MGTEVGPADRDDRSHGEIYGHHPASSHFAFAALRASIFFCRLSLFRSCCSSLLRFFLFLMALEVSCLLLSFFFFTS